MRDKADSCPISTLISKNGEEKSFQVYWVFLPTK